ncbi:MAG TPA: type II toxin-antitoxin system mRNA interferase toxin, RelE/StbE family [Anaerolineae bacterium]|nr:type II toxin-antitoxin system mRNA interferase toxin, RelE/StbE family [Anaerolineae bacterium]HNU03487.1 type II toxin-antitoxin system mRNA interferase toxin, RelE/StbE family [Anaerolineae bacterium]
MRKLVWDASFRRAFKGRTRNDRGLQERILDTIDDLVANPFLPKLKTHKLKGRLDGLWACTVEYDCRIIFFFASDPDEEEDVIVLVDLGSHDEVY